MKTIFAALVLVFAMAACGPVGECATEQCPAPELVPTASADANLAQPVYALPVGADGGNAPPSDAAGLGTAVVVQPDAAGRDLGTATVVEQ